MVEESEALLHSSKGMNKTLKSLLTLALIICISSTEYAIIQVVTPGNALSGIDFYFGVLFDNAALMFPFVLLGLFTNINSQGAEIIGTIPFLFMVLFSSSFSPGSGVQGVKILRYMFSRFYLWCMIPEVEGSMEGCPDDNVLLYLILTSMLFSVMIIVFNLKNKIRKQFNVKKQAETIKKSMITTEFAELQVELFGIKALNRLQHLQGTTHSDLDMSK